MLNGIFTAVGHGRRCERDVVCKSDDCILQMLNAIIVPGNTYTYA